MKLAIVDDDPTGTQTVRDVPLLTNWGDSDLAWALQQADPLFAILTNSRALPRDRAAAVNAEIGWQLGAAAERSDRQLRVISRSDSTLRGHFPAEVEALAEGLRRSGQEIDCVLICPAYPEAGRITVRGLHLVRRDERFVPVAETDYARDTAFGYRSSNLAEWVRERVGQDVPVGAITIDDIREGGPDRVAELLGDAVGHSRYLVVDSVETSDLDLLAWGLSLAEQQGVRVLCRTGPSFLPARAGLAPALPLSMDEIAVRGGRGLVVVGSHSELTSEQLDEACARHSLEVVTLDVEALLAATEGDRSALIGRTVDELRRRLAGGSAALVTSRREANLEPGEQSLLKIGSIADAIVEVVRSVVPDVALDWLVAKGGITSNDVAVKALGARRAVVLGQVFPGQVSVWQLDGDAVAAGLRYVVFPGNVGDRTTLAETLERLGGLR